MKPFLHIATMSDISSKSSGNTSLSLSLRIALKLSVIIATGFLLTTAASAATVTNRVTGAANWNTAATWIQNRTGTVTFTNGSKNVTGVGTSFLTELSVGDVLMLQASPGTVRGTIASITNNTQLVLVANATANANGAYGRQQVPGASDDVVIGNANLTSPAVTITLNVAAATVNSLTFTATAVANSLTHSGTNSLTVSSNVTVNQPTAAVTVAWNVNGGAATVNGNLTIGGANTTASRVSRIAVTTGSLTVNGTASYASNSVDANEVITVSTGTITFTSNLTFSSGTLTITSTGTIDFNGNLAYGGANTPTFTTVAGSNILFEADYTGTTSLVLDPASNQTFTASSTITANSPNLISFGNVQLNSGSALTLTSGGIFYVGGNWTNNGGTLSAAAATAVQFYGSGKTIGGTSSTTFPVIEIYNQSVTNSSYTMNNSNSATGLLFDGGTVATSLTLGSASVVLTINGTVTLNQPTASVTEAWNINAGTATVSGLITFAGANATTTLVSKIAITTGTLNANGGVTFTASAAATKVVDMSGGAGTLNLKGALTVPAASSTLTAGTSGSIFNYADTSAQTVNFFSAGAYHNLHTNNTNANGATLSAAITTANVTGNLRVQTGTCSNGGFAIAGNAGKVFEVVSGATFNVAGTSSAFPTGFGTFTLGTTSTVDYTGTGAQTVVAQNYGHLTSSSSGTRTLANSGTIGVAGTFTPGTNTFTITGSTIDFNGSAAQTIPAFNYNNLTSSSNGTRTLANGGTIGIAGVFTPGTNTYTNTGSTIDFNGGSAQTVPAFNYNNLSSSSNGARTLANSGTIGVAATFTPGANSYTITGSTIDFNGSGAQTVPAFSYNNLTSSSSGPRTLANGGTIGIAGVFTPGTNTFTITGSTIDFNGSGAQTIPAFNYNNLTSSSNGARTLVNSGTIGIAGVFTPGTNTFTITGSTIDFNGSGAQTIPAFNYNNLTSSSNGARTLANSGTIGVAGVFTPGTNTFTITGSTIDFNGSGAQTVPAFNYNNLTSSSNGPRTLANSGTIGIAGVFTPGTNTFTITGSTIDFKGAGAQTVPAFNYNNLTISGSRAANNVTLASSGTIGIAGTLADTATFNSGNGFITTGSTVDYNGTGSQSVTVLSPLAAGNTYNNLTISNTASPVSASTSFSVGGTFTQNINVIFAPAAAVVISGGGTLTGSGTVQVTRATGSADFANQYTITNKTLTNLTVEFAGAAAQGTDAVTFGGLKINNSSGVTLSGNATVNGTLTLSGGNITTGSSRVIISSTGTASRISGYVFGNLQKNVATGATAKTFEVGDASNYTPVNVSFASVTNAGDLTVNATSGDHPSLTNSTIIPSRSVNRYWTLTNSGIVFTTYSATFNFVSGDVDAGTDTNALVVGNFVPAVWTYPAVGTRTSNSTQATGLSAFGDFQLGEGGMPSVGLQKDVTPLGDQEPGTELTYTVTFTNTGSIPARSLVITDPDPTDVNPARRVFVNLDYKLSSASISSPWSATIEFSNDGGATWNYSPVSGGGNGVLGYAPAGYDRAVTNIRWSVSGNVAVSDTGSVSFISRIR